MSLLEQLMDNNNSQEIFDRIVQVLDEDSSKKLMCFGLSEFYLWVKQNKYVAMYGPKKQLKSLLYELCFYTKFWSQQTPVQNILSFLHWTDFRCKFVCTKWNEILNQVFSDNIMAQPYLTIAPEMLPRRLQLDYLLPMRENSNNSIPCTVKILSSTLKYHEKLGPYVVIADRENLFCRAFINWKLMVILDTQGQISKFKKDTIIKITKSRYDFVNHNLYMDDCIIIGRLCH